MAPKYMRGRAGLVSSGEVLPSPLPRVGPKFLDLGRVCLQSCSINHLTIANHTPINRKKIIFCKQFCPAHIVKFALPCPAVCSRTVPQL